MKLWRLTREPFAALDGAGAVRNGARYAPEGARIVSLASDAALAVLIALRYLPRDLRGIPDDFVLGWTEVDAAPLRLVEAGGEEGIRAQVGAWLDSKSALLAAVTSRVLPEGDVIMLNPAHPAAANVPPLTLRPFSFADCLHRPPMLDRYAANSG